MLERGDVFVMKKGYYAVRGPSFNGVVRSLKEFNEQMLGKKKTYGKRFTSEQEAQAWLNDCKNGNPKMTKPKTKYYAVHTPDFTGLIYSAKAFNSKIKNKKMAFGKRFNNENDAHLWLKQFDNEAMETKKQYDTENQKGEEIQKTLKEAVIANGDLGEQVIMYIDGGYKDGHGKYGVVAYLPKMKVPIYRNFGHIFDQQFNDLKNAGAELMACIRALEWAYANNMKVVHILYDFQGIEDHLVSEANHSATVIYQQMVARFRQYMQIHFLHICHGNKELHRAAHQLTQLTL